MGLLSSVQGSAAKKPPRTFFYAREKWGKSSMASYAKKPIFFMTRGETGLLELLSAGSIKDTPHFPYDPIKPPTWPVLMQAIQELIKEPHDYSTFVIDTANGAETLCQDHVRMKFFENNQKKFANYGKGMEQCRILWGEFLAMLDQLREVRNVAPLMLAHTEVKKFDDPTADDSYDKYRPACNPKLWEITHKWADCICFGHFQPEVYEADNGKMKAKGQMNRVICFDQSPCWEAGNRYGITGQVLAMNGAQSAWEAFASRFDGRYNLNPLDGKPTAVKPDPVLFVQMMKFMENSKDMAELEPHYKAFWVSREKFTAEQIAEGNALKDRLKAKFAAEAAAKVSEPK